MTEVINMATVTNDGTLQSPEMCLKNCLETDIGKRGAFKNGKKLLIIAVDDTHDDYDVSWCQAGMKFSETIAMLEITKEIFLNSMDF